MIQAYPVILEPDNSGFYVNIPDLSIGTQGNTIEEAISMARNAILEWGIYEQDIGHSIPSPSKIDEISTTTPNILTWVDVDFDAFRKKNQTKMIRRNITLPSWLDTLANENGINVSQITQEALKEKLNC